MSAKKLSLKKVLKKYSKIQNDISETFEKYNEKSYATQSKIGQNASIKSKVVEQASEIMGDIIENMDLEIEIKEKNSFFKKTK